MRPDECTALVVSGLFVHALLGDCPHAICSGCGFCAKFQCQSWWKNTHQKVSSTNPHRSVTDRCEWCLKLSGSDFWSFTSNNH